MRDKKASSLAALLLLAVGVCYGQPQSGPLAAVSHSMNEVVRPFIKDAWATAQQSGDAELRRPDETPPTVEVPELGVTFEGTTTWTLNNRTVNSFLGIRFANYVGRFMYSTVAGSGDYKVEENGMVRADHTGPKCYQMSSVGKFATGEDDCFFLNVYVPADKKDDVKLPVMVFIHGGSFTSGDSSFYLPTRLLDEDVILVVIQYRLGALGWLSLLNQDVPGNAGLSDQLNALRWVKSYISSFGGDPEKVTVFGESAGSVSVSLIVTVADPTEELFAGAIAESGSAFEYWAIDEHPLESATRFAEHCSCTDTITMAAVQNCLQNEKSSEELVLCTHDYVLEQRQNAQLGFDSTSPVVQGDESWALIRMMPIEYVEQGLGNKVPFLSGCNRDEGSYVFALITEEYLKPNNLMNDTEYLANEAIPDILVAAGIDDSTRAFSHALQEKFFPGVDMTSYDEMAPGMIDMSGMLFLKSGTYNYAKLHSQYSAQNTYYYSFDFESQNSLFDLTYLGTDPPFDGGITHGDELIYLFGLPSAMDESQRLTSDRLVKLWTNFAKTGNPTPDGPIDDLALPEWMPITEDGMNYLLIQDEVTVENYYPDRYTIRMDIERGDVSTEAPTSSSQAPDTVSQGKYDDLQKQSDAFMACMIVFIVLFVISTGAAVFFYLKTR
ncbi:Carboxylesterase type B [Trinorchestia longiramus]|nr:Carboxylesterase type B [Trinorchestia longiramus]